MKQQDDIKILLVFVVGFNLLSLLFKTPILFYIGTGIGVLGMLFPLFAKWFAWFWMKLAHVLGKINGGILLSIIFFLFLFPIALLQKVVSRKDNLQLKRPSGSNFITRDKTFQKEDLENMW